MCSVKSRNASAGVRSTWTLLRTGSNLAPSVVIAGPFGTAWTRGGIPSVLGRSPPGGLVAVPCPSPDAPDRSSLPPSRRARGHRLHVVLERGEALVPHRADRAHPGFRLREGLGAELVAGLAADPRGGGETRFLQRIEVL